MRDAVKTLKTSCVRHGDAVGKEILPRRSILKKYQRTIRTLNAKNTQFDEKADAFIRQPFPASFYQLINLILNVKNAHFMKKLTRSSVSRFWRHLPFRRAWRHFRGNKLVPEIDFHKYQLINLILNVKNAHFMKKLTRSSVSRFWRHFPFRRARRQF